MGKRKVWQKMLALLLALSMVFSTQTMSVFADIVGAEIVPRQQQDVVENSNTNTGGTTDLNALLTSAEFGTETVHVGTTYTISLAFKETITDQFAEGETLEYTFPSGFVPEASASGTFYLKVTDNNTGNTVNVGASYRTEGQKLLVTVDTTDPNYEMYTRAADVAFSLDIRMTVTEDAQTGEVVFGDKVKKDVTVSNESGLTVTKEGAYDKTNGKFNYTVRVTSTGTNNNVTITDTIEGTLLTYNKDLVVKGSSEVGGSVTSEDDNGFTYVEALMVDGEVLTLQYSASIDYSKLTGSKFTTEQTGNGVKVTSDEDGDGDEASKDFNNVTAYDLISKTHTNVDSANVGNQIVTWKIVLNEDCLVSVAGQTVTDTIAESSQNIMKYTGNGITVKRYNAAGAQVGSDENISWGELEVDPDSACSWSWTIPETDTKPYKYVITYDTAVDGSGLWSGNASVENNASFGGDSDGDSAGVEPGSDFQVTKTHTAANGNERWVDWKIDVTVPASGYSTFWLEDTLRTIWADINGTSTVICHKLVADTLKVEGLEPGETYDTTFSYVTGHPVVEGYNLSGFTMTFYKDAEKTQTGLQETDAERVITVTFRTEYPSEWVQREMHRNTVTVYNDQGNKTAYDEFTLSSTQIDKELRLTFDQDGMPVIVYNIVIGGVSDSSVEVIDNFDTTLFEFYEGPYYNGEMQVGAGESKEAAINAAGNGGYGDITHEENDSGLKFTLTNLRTDQWIEGKWFSWYAFRYALKVKDQDALNKIEAAAMASTDGKATYTNTATSNGASDSVDWEYTYEPVEKSITTWPSATNNYTVTFTLKVNEGGDTLNNGDSLELTDYMTGLQYVYGSMQVTVGGEVREDYPFTLSTAGTSSTIVWEIPDSTPVTITYQAKVQGTGSVSYSNTATLMGKYSSGTGNQQVTIDYSGQGTGNVYNVEIVKVDADDPNTVLSGATFKLQCYEEDHDPATSKPGSLTGVNETQYDPVYTTGSDGTVTIISDQGNGWALWPGILYCLQEITAPQNYTKGGDIWFYIPDGNEIPSYVSQAVKDGTCFLVGKGTAQIVITNNKSESGQITVTKKVTYNGAADNVTGTFYVALFSDEGETRVSDVKAIELNNASQGTAIFDNLTVGSTYYVYETDKEGAPVGDGFEYAVDGQGSPVTIERGNLNKTAELTNNKSESGQITVTKKVTYNGAADNVTGTFYVALFSDEGETRVSDVKAIELNNASQGTAIFDNLTVGSTYYVYETDKEGAPVGDGFEYAVDGQGSPVTIERGNLNKTAELTNNKSESGQITVTKKVTYNGAADNVTGTFYVALFSDEGETRVSDVKAIELNNASQGTAIFDNLTVGSTYYVYETDKEGAPVGDGFEYAVDGQGSPVTIERGNLNKTAELTNNKSESGQITVTKKVTYNGAADNVTGTFYVALFSDEGETRVSDVKAIELNNASQGTAIFDNLTVGSTYYVYETDKEGAPVGDGFEYAVDGQGSPVTIERGNLNKTAELTNNKSESGQITVTKKVTYNGAADNVTGTFYVALFSDEGETRVSDVKAIELNNASQGTAIFDNLTVGSTYYVYETDKEGAPVGDGFEYAVDGQGSPVTIERGNLNKTAELTNNKSESGQITVTKKVTYNGAADNVTGTFYVALFSDEGETRVSDVKAIELNNASQGTAIFDNLTVGSTYYVYETDKEGAPVGDGFEYAVDGQGSPVTIERGNLNKTAELTNNKSESGQITVTKKVTYNGAADNVTGTFYVALFSDEGETRVSDVKAIELNNASQGTAIFDNLTVGSTYYVYETDKEGAPVGDGFEYAVDGQGSPVTIERGNLNKTAELTNNKSESGQITVTKKVTYNGAADNVTGTFYVALFSDEGETRVSDVKAIELNNASQGTAIFDNLTVGSTYYVYETDKEGAPVGDGFEYAVDGQGSPVTIERGNLNKTAELTNNKSESGQITVTKKVTYNGAADNVTGTFYVALFSDEGETRVSDVKAIELNNASQGTAIFDNLTVGSTYYVYETDKEGAPVGDGFEYAVDGQGSPVTIERGNLNKTAELTNNKSESGQITVTKKVTYNGAADNVTGTFYVALFSDEGETRVSDVKAIELNNASQGTAIFDNLTVGSTYYVYETDKEGAPVGDGFEYAVDGQGSPVTIERGNLNKTAELTNNKSESGQITVTKKVTYNGAADNVTGTFYVALFSDEGETRVSDVKAIELNNASQGTAIFDNLTVGSTYYVYETDKEGAPVGDGFEYAVDGQGSPVTIERGNLNKTAELTNNKSESGQITVTKKVTYNGAADNVTGTFYVALFSDEGETRVSDVKAIELNNASQGTAIFDNLTVGSTYYVYETDKEGAPVGDGFEYAVDGQGSPVTIERGNLNKTAELTNNKSESGQITVTKKVTYNGAADNVTGTFYVALFSDEGETRVSDVKAIELNNASQGTAIFDNLTVGSTYYVYETDKEGAPVGDGFEYAVDGQGSPVTIERGNLNKTAELTNNKSESGQITVTKKVTYNGAADNVTGTFYVALFSDEGETRVSDVKAIELNNASQGTAIFDNLTVGSTYYVYETDKEGAPVGDGFEYAVDGQGSPVTIERGNLNKTAELTNNKSESGQITVTKKVTYNGAADNVTGTFYVALFSDEGETRVSDVKAIELNNASQGTAIFDNLTVGSTYYVYETDKEGAPVGDGFEYAVDGQGSPVTIERGNLNKTAELTNNKSESGQITVTKKVTYNGAADNVTGTFYVALFSDEGETRVSDVKAIELNNASQGTAIFDNLTVGSTYYVYETDKEGAPVGDGFEYAVDGQGSPVTIERGNLNKTAELTNNKSESGQITVTKKVTYNGAADNVTGTFYVALFSDEGETRVSDVKAIELNNASQGTAIFDNLTVGSTYYVYETDKEGAPVGDGFEYAVDGQGSPVTIERGNLNKTAELTNNKSESGQITVTKKVTYNGAADNVTGTFYVALFSDEGETRVSDVKAIELNNASQGTAIFDNLTVGSTYYVYETDKEGAPVGDGFEYAVDGQGSPVTIERGNLNKTAELTNNKSESGQITVTKKVTYNGAADNVTGTFYVALFSDEGETRVSDVKAIELNNASQGTAIFDNLTVGSTYYVYETDKEGAPVGDGFEYAVDGQGSPVTIERGNLNKTAELTNNKSESGQITVTKKVTYNGAADNVTGTFYVALFSDEGETRVSDVKAIELNNASQGTAIFDNLTVGSTYYVYETDKEGAPVGDGFEYAVDGQGSPVTIERGNLNKTAELTNNKISVKISKVDVTTQEELEGAHIQILDKEGNVVEEWDSTGEAHEVTGLKTGETYTLRETVAPDGYTITSDTTFVLKEDGSIDTDKATTTVSEEGVLLVEDKLTSVKISKVDITTQEELEGAHIQILDKEGNVVEEWDSTGEAHEVTGLKTGETYTLRETVAPDGYTITSDTTFVLKEDGSIDTDKTTTTVSEEGVLLVEDKLTSVKISKVDITTQEELEGAHIQILDKEGNVVEEWDSTGEAHEVTGLKTGETYTLRETVAPDGYTITSDTTFVLKEDGSIDTDKATTTVSEEGVLLVEDKLTSVKISKVDITTQEELEGAHIQILDKEGNVVEEWDSTGEAHEVTGLKTGETYTLRETVAPDGYTITSDTTFVLKEDGSIDTDKATTTVSEEGVLLVEDKLTSVKISKVDITTQEELEGAHIQILDKEGNVVEEWDSTGEAHEVTGLKTGETYTLRETVAPDGYTITSDTTFVLKEDGSIDTDNTTTTVNEEGVLLVEDQRFEGSVRLTKTNETGTVLAGAQFQLFAEQEDGTYAVYSSAVSANGLYETDENGVLEVTNLPEGNYYFVETKAPKGYVITTDDQGQPVRYHFSVAPGEETAAAELTVTNESGTEGSISVTKRTTMFDGDIVDVAMKDATFYVGIFTDAEGTQPYGTDYVKEIHMSGQSVSETVVFSGLETGTYYILETDAQGNPIPLDTLQTDGNKSFTCMVDGDGTNMVELDLAADKVEGAVYLNNLYYQLPDGYYMEGQISITKNVLVGGERSTVDDVFYAGIFTEDGTLVRVIELTQNGTVTVPVSLGGENGTDPITYYVRETDASGTPVNYETFAYSVSGEGTVALDVNNTSASITITNELVEEEEETEITTETTTSEKTETTGKNTTSGGVKTGDNTPIGMYLMLLAASAAVIAGLFIRRRRRNDA